MSLQGKNAVITGGANGIGFATAEEFLKSGVKNLLLLDLGEKLDSAKETQLKACNPSAVIFYAQCDITNSKQLEKVLRQDAIKWMNSVDILVNIAGIFNESTPERCIAVNVSALISASTIVFDLMTKENSGHGGTIVNIASLAGLIPFRFGAVYSATKHAVVGYTRSMGNEQIFDKTGVKMMAICPGFTSTDLICNPQSGQLTFSWLTPDYQKLMESYTLQSPNVVGKAIIKAITEGQTGSVWAAVDGKIGQVNFEANHHIKFED